MSTTIPSLIFSLGVCLNLYLFLDRLKTAKAKKTNKQTKVMFQFGLWAFTVVYWVGNALVLPLPLWMFSACLFLFAFVFPFSINNSINKHQIKE